MDWKRIIRTTPVRRLALALIPLSVVDLILAPISLLKGSPSARGFLVVNAAAILILALRFALLYAKRLWCKACGKGSGVDTGADDGGYPVVECPKCGDRWIL